MVDNLKRDEFKEALKDTAEEVQKVGIHGAKLQKAKLNKNLPQEDKEALDLALEKYADWMISLNELTENTGKEYIKKAVYLLNDYKFYIDYYLIFNRHSDFLYRQKGQLKLDNTIMEEFLPVMVFNALTIDGLIRPNIQIGTQTKTFSSIRFIGNLVSDDPEMGLEIKTKDQDFAITKRLFVKTSQTEDFNEEKARFFDLGYIMAEMKTNLDKTMFQEASATAKDVKCAIPNAKYFLLAEFLDMPPISTLTTEIDEVLILRKAKRLNSNFRSKFAKWETRKTILDEYRKFLKENPYDAELFIRLYNNIVAVFSESLNNEKEILKLGYF